MSLSDNPLKGTMTKEELEASTIKYAVKMAAITVMVVVVSMASCTMMPEFIDEETAKVETAKSDSSVKISAQKHTEEMAKIAAIEKLIKEEKIDPIAARCAVEGWGDRDSEVCIAVVTGKTDESGIAVVTGKTDESGRVSISYN